MCACVCLYVCTAGLVLAAVVVTSGTRTTTLIQRDRFANYQSASQRVAMAQAKVARDLAALRRTEGQVCPQHKQKCKRKTGGEIDGMD